MLSMQYPFYSAVYQRQLTYPDPQKKVRQMNKQQSQRGFGRGEVGVLMFVIGIATAGGAIFLLTQDMHQRPVYPFYGSTAFHVLLLAFVLIGGGTLFVMSEASRLQIEARCRRELEK